jgi:hypothetical protein
VQGALALWAMIRQCGLDSKQDMKSYSPSEPVAELGGISVAALLDRWRGGQDIKIFDVKDEAALRFADFVQPTPYMHPYLPL